VEISTLQQLRDPRVERLLGLVVDPYFITAASAVATAAIATMATFDRMAWLVVVAAVAGWSSAWSP
jgi:hypothetical protein